MDDSLRKSINFQRNHLYRLHCNILELAVFNGWDSPIVAEHSRRAENMEARLEYSITCMKLHTIRVSDVDPPPYCYVEEEEPPPPYSLLEE